MLLRSPERTVGFWVMLRTRAEGGRWWRAGSVRQARSGAWVRFAMGTGSRGPCLEGRKGSGSLVGAGTSPGRSGVGFGSSVAGFDRAAGGARSCIKPCCGGGVVGDGPGLVLAVRRGGVGRRLGFERARGQAFALPGAFVPARHGLVRGRGCGCARVRACGITKRPRGWVRTCTGWKCGGREERATAWVRPI